MEYIFWFHIIHYNIKLWFLIQLFLAFLCSFGSRLIDMIKYIKIFQFIIAVIAGWTELIKIDSKWIHHIDNLICLYLWEFWSYQHQTYSYYRICIRGCLFKVARIIPEKQLNRASPCGKTKFLPKYINTSWNIYTKNYDSCLKLW